jgi:competence protein ComEA
MMFTRQIKGIIAVSVILAFIPFISFLYSSRLDSKFPILSTSNSDSLIIEVIGEDGKSGVFFIEPGISASQMFAKLDVSGINAENIKLQNGMKVRFVRERDQRSIVIDKMGAEKRLALGLPLDINLASHDELMLIPGVGDVSATNIMAWRKRLGRFEKLDQLMDIKGIKEKKMSKLRPYLYVDKLAQ